MEKNKKAPASTGARSEVGTSTPCIKYITSHKITSDAICLAAFAIAIVHPDKPNVRESFIRATKRVMELPKPRWLI